MGRIPKVRNEVLRLLSLGYSTKTICERLSLSRTRFYFLRKKLQKLGSLDHTFFYKVDNQKDKSFKSNPLGVLDFRLHRTQLKIRVRKWLVGWGECKGVWKCTGFGGRARYCLIKIPSSLGLVTVKAYRESLNVFLPSFWGMTVLECDKQMMSFLHGFIPKLEQELCVVGECFDVVRREYAKVGALNAVEHVKRKERILVRDQNGELRYVVDKSLGVPEFEAVHAELSRGDAVRFERLYNDVASGKYDLLVENVVQMSKAMLINTKHVEALLKLKKKELSSDDERKFYKPEDSTDGKPGYIG